MPTPSDNPEQVWLVCYYDGSGLHEGLMIVNTNEVHNIHEFIRKWVSEIAGWHLQVAVQLHRDQLDSNIAPGYRYLTWDDKYVLVSELPVLFPTPEVSIP